MVSIKTREATRVSVFLECGMGLKHSKILFFQFLIGLLLVSGGCQESRVGNDYYDLQFTERPGDGLRWGISCPSDSLGYICSWRKEALWSKDRSFFILQKPGRRLGASVGQLIPVYNKDSRKAVVAHQSLGEEAGKCLVEAPCSGHGGKRGQEGFLGYQC